MGDLQEIEDEIKKLKQELKDVKGKRCEIYIRIVGYYRPIKNWNAGKTEEQKYRKMFDPKLQSDNSV